MLVYFRNGIADLIGERMYLAAKEVKDLDRFAENKLLCARPLGQRVYDLLRSGFHRLVLIGAGKNDSFSRRLS